ncbi:MULTISPECIES: hypothetical protein [unclassified Meridianimarinicoccus]|uniref:hypothetical protein n=1 Tax=unclassified Meridianimarinicoccus TaxID=2923344 RepID=UPI001867E54C|nr:hypothetical protein [Fluviibacterium sp. MJW13]
MRDPLVTHNERVKLFAGFISAIGLGLIGFAILRPAVEDWQNVRLTTLWWGAGGLALHGVSHYILRYIRKEMPQ